MVFIFCLIFLFNVRFVLTFCCKEVLHSGNRSNFIIITKLKKSQFLFFSVFSKLKKKICIFFYSQHPWFLPMISFNFSSFLFFVNFHSIKVLVLFLFSERTAPFNSLSSFNTFKSFSGFLFNFFLLLIDFEHIYVWFCLPQGWKMTHTLCTLFFQPLVCPLDGLCYYLLGYGRVCCCILHSYQFMFFLLSVFFI